jgi:dTDP-4-dehydrorhamnose 3,5-epimerase
MQFLDTRLVGLFVVEPQLFSDARGYFMETFHEARFRAAGIECRFVQVNQSHSTRGVLRGLHYQIQQPQGKLVQAVRGEIFDVAVDLRRSSRTFAQWEAVKLSEENHRQLYIPAGFAHGFCVLSDSADVIYYCSDFYAPQHERTLLWSDPTLAIDWPVRDPIVSEKDRHGLALAETPHFD